MHATALSLPFLDKEGEWGFLDGLPIRMTLSPLLARRPINLRYEGREGGKEGRRMFCMPLRSPSPSLTRRESGAFWMDCLYE